MMFKKNRNIQFDNGHKLAVAMPTHTHDTCIVLTSAMHTCVQCFFFIIIMDRFELSSHYINKGGSFCGKIATAMTPC